MRFVFRALKRIRAVNAVRRMYTASRYYNRKYSQIVKWGFTSREDTNYTFELTDGNYLYLAHTVSAVLNISLEEVFRYIEEARSDKELEKHILSAIEQSPLKKFADKRVLFGRRLGWYVFVRVMKPKVVIETGVDKGMGSVLLCSALLRNKEEGHEGHYFGTDINPAAGYFLSGKYAEIGKILFGDSIETLKKFTEKVDLFINDSDHSDSYEYEEYKVIAPLLSERAVILGDNAHCTDKLALFSKETGRRFIFFKEEPANHWYPGAGIGISYPAR